MNQWGGLSPTTLNSPQDLLSSNMAGPEIASPHNFGSPEVSPNIQSPDISSPAVKNSDIVMRTSDHAGHRAKRNDTLQSSVYLTPNSSQGALALKSHESAYQSNK